MHCYENSSKKTRKGPFGSYFKVKIEDQKEFFKKNQKLNFGRREVYIFLQKSRRVLSDEVKRRRKNAFYYLYGLILKITGNIPLPEKIKNTKIRLPAIEAQRIAFTAEDRKNIFFLIIEDKKETPFKAFLNRRQKDHPL